MSPRPGVNPFAAEVGVAPVIACAAGAKTLIEVHIRHPGPRVARITVTLLGLDPAWVEGPTVIGSMEPGDITRVLVPVQVEPGALGARYPFAVTVESTDLLGNGAPVISAAESILDVDSREKVVVAIEPAQVTTVFGRKLLVRITNPSREDRDLTLKTTSPPGIGLRLDATGIGVPAGRTVSIRGRVKVNRPRLFGTVQAHTYALAVRGQGAPVVVEGTARARPLLRGALVRSLAVVLVVALWAGMAVFAIPRVASLFTTEAAVGTEAGSQTTPADQPPTGTGNETGVGGTAEPEGGGGADGAGGADAGAGGGADSGGGAGAGGDADAGANPGGAGGDGTESGDGAAGGGQPEPADAGLRLRGTVTGPQPDGVTVDLTPTSLVEAADAGAEPADGVTDEQTASGLRSAREAIGKIPSWAIRQTSRADDPPTTASTTTSDAGSFSVSGIKAPGLYLLTFSKAGYQTQRFIVNADTLAGSAPMKVELKAGEGSMSGSVAGPDGPIGAATITLTDGRVSLQTSTVSEGGNGAPGSWNVTGLSTPGTYLVSAASPGFATASSLVTLDAGGTATTDLTLVTGAAAITGQVSGLNQFGQLGGLGGISVVASGQSNGVTTTRTATTVTSGPVGRFTLPDLPTPGDYTVTVTGVGYQDQVQQISLPAGAGAVDLAITLTRADGVVSGTVLGDPAQNGQPDEGGLIGAGLTLTGPDVSFKTMTTSDPAGAFRFTGVPPGTYVLTGSMFGRLSSSVTVELTAAAEVTADLRLIGAADTELPADGRIRGRAVDARTGGPLTCDRAPKPAGPCLVTASVQIPVPDPDTGRITADSTTEEATTTAGPAEEFEYTLPDLDDTAHPGLVPGLYTVTLTAPGYEQTTVSVRVAQGQIAAASPGVMQPLGLISGIVTTRVGTPGTPTCVVVVPAGSADPTSCTPNPDKLQCTTDGGPGQQCSQVQTDGTYAVSGLVHGSYSLSVLPTDREYQAPPPFSVQLELGADFRYDPVLNRYGRFAVTVMEPDEQSGTLEPFKDAVVTAIDANGQEAARATTDGTGAATLTGLDGTYTIRAAHADPAAGAAELADQSVSLNQSPPVTLVLTTQIGPFIGQVAVVVNTGLTAQQPVPGARVTVTGLIGYDGAEPKFGEATVTTDANGCYAIVPPDWGDAPVESTDPAAPDCPAITAPSAIGTMLDRLNNPAALVSRPVTVDVAAVPDKTLDFHSAGTLNVTGNEAVKFLSTIIVGAKPVPIGNVTLTSSSPVTGDIANVSTATINVISAPPGTGTPLTVTVNANGTLAWTDPNAGGAGLVIPGRYVLQANMPASTGWATATGYLLCDLGTPCRLVNSATGAGPGSFVLLRYPRLSGTISGAPLPGGTNFNQISVASSPQGPFVFTGANNTPAPPAGLPVTGTISFQDTSLLAPSGFIRPGNYTFTVSLSGYRNSAVNVTCGSDYLAAQPGGSTGCSAFVVNMNRLPTFSGTVSLSRDTTPDNQPIPVSSVAVAVANHSEVTVTVGATGNLTWDDSTQPDGIVVPGNYQLSYSRSGFVTQTVPFVCSATVATCSPPAVVLQMLPMAGGTVNLQPPPVGQVDLTRASVTVVQPAGTGIQVTLARVLLNNGQFTLQWKDPNLFAGIVPEGQYRVSVHIPGYADVLSDEFTCTAGGSCGPVVTMQANPQFSGTLTLNPAGNPAAAQIRVTPPAGVGRVTVTAAANGTLRWQEEGTPAGSASIGRYTVSVTLAGYETLTDIPFDCERDSCTLNLTLQKPTDLTVTLVANTGANPVGAWYFLTSNGVTTQLNADPLSSSVVFRNLSSTDQDYQLRVQAAGFSTAQIDSTSPSVSCAPGSTGLVLRPGPVTCTVTMSALGRVPVSSKGVVPGGSEVLASATVTAQRLPASGTTPDPGAANFVTVTSTTGDGLLTGTNDVAGLEAGRWLITADRAGYIQTLGVITIDPTTFAPAVESGGPGANGAGLVVTAGRLTVTLAPSAVTLQVHLKTVTGQEILPDTTVTLSGGSSPISCRIVPTDLTGCSPAVPGVSYVVDGTSRYLSFAGIVPTTYLIDVRGGSGQFAPLSQQVLISAGNPNPSISLILSANWSTQSGSVVDAAGTAQAGAVVSLNASANPNTPAPDASGNPLLVTTGADGRFTFNKVPDLTYTVVTKKDGWEAVRAPVVVIKAATNPFPADVSVTVTTRERRAVTVTLDTSTQAPGGGPVNLAGAAVTLNPVPGSQPPGTPDNTPLTGLTVTANANVFTVTANQVPTGSWTLALTSLSGAAFPPFTTDAFAVPAADPSAPPAPVLVAKTIWLGLATITVNWPAGCGPPPATGTLPIELTRDGVATAVTLNATVTINGDGSGSAAVSELLPAGLYDWAAKPTAAGWTGGTGSFRVPETGTAPILVSSTGTLDSPGVPVTVTLTVDGSAVTGRTVAATAGGTTVTGATGAPLCLSPGTDWTLDMNDPSPSGGNLPLMVDSQTVTVSRGGPNSATFEAFRVEPAVTLATVAGRTPDTAPRQVALRLTDSDNAVLWPAGGSAAGSLTMPGNSNTVAGPALLVGGGSHTLTATTAPTDAFSTGTLVFDPSDSGTAANVELPYAAVMLTVTATTGGTPVAGAVVTVTPSGGGTPVVQTATDGSTVFRDLRADPTTYSVRATATGVSGEVTGRTFPAGVRTLEVPMAAPN